MTFIKNFSIIFIVLTIIDFLWLGIIMKSFYQKELAPIGRFMGGSFQPNLLAALGVYLLIALGVTLFVLPKVQTLGLLATFGWGALFGVVLYGVYDLTNYSILAQWTARMVIVDMAWGTILGGALAVIARLIGLKA